MQRRPPFLIAHLAMGSVAIFYGINYFTLKQVFSEGLDSFAVLAIRCFFTAIFFLIFHSLAIGEKIRSGKDYLLLMLCALFGVTLNQIFFLWGLSLTSRVNASVLMITTPVFVFLTAWLLKEERITMAKLTGLIVSFVGAAGLILGASKETLSISGASISGDVMIIGNAASYGFYLVLVRPLVLRYNTFTIIKWIFLFGSVPNILIGIPPLLRSEPSNFTASAIFGIAFLIVFATIGAYVLNAWAMKVVPSSAVGIYIYVQPVFVTLLSSGLGMGELNWLSIPFILLIFAGVYLVSFRNVQQMRQVPSEL